MTRLSFNQHQWTAEHREIAEKICNGPRGRLSGPFPVLLQHPELALRIQELGQFLRFNGSLDDALREAAILVTARHWNAEYEWEAHEKLALSSGLHSDVIEGIRSRAVSPAASSLEAAIIRFCLELHGTGTVSDVTYDDAEETIGPRGVIELITICGYYAMVAMVLNVAEIGKPAS